MDALRAEIVLRAAEGMNNCEIADAVGVTRQTVRTWRERFAQHCLDGLDDEPRCGAPRKIGDDRIEAIVVKTLETKPGFGEQRNRKSDSAGFGTPGRSESGRSPSATTSAPTALERIANDSAVGQGRK